MIRKTLNLKHSSADIVSPFRPLNQTIARLRESPKKATAGEIKAESLDAVEQLVSDLLLNRVYSGDKKDSASLVAARGVIAGESS